MGVSVGGEKHCDTYAHWMADVSSERQRQSTKEEEGPEARKIVCSSPDIILCRNIASNTKDKPEKELNCTMHGWGNSACAWTTNHACGPWVQEEVASADTHGREVDLAWLRSALDRGELRESL